MVGIFLKRLNRWLFFHFYRNCGKQHASRERIYDRRVVCQYFSVNSFTLTDSFNLQTCSIMTKTPLVIVGKPGSSKTLAMTIVRDRYFVCPTAARRLLHSMIIVYNHRQSKLVSPTLV